MPLMRLAVSAGGNSRMRSGRTAATAAAPAASPRGNAPAISVPSRRHARRRRRRARAEIHHADEVGDEAVGRMLVDRVRRVALQQPAVLQHRHAVGHDQRFLLVVGDDDEGDADLVLQALQLHLHGAAQLLVERAERLVEQQQRAAA